MVKRLISFSVTSRVSLNPKPSKLVSVCKAGESPNLEVSYFYFYL